MDGEALQGAGPQFKMSRPISSKSGMSQSTNRYGGRMSSTMNMGAAKN